MKRSFLVWQVVRFLHGVVDQMATSLTVSSKFSITSYRSEVFGDCGNVDQGRSAKKHVLLSNSLLGSGRLFRHHVQNRPNQEGKKGTSPCQALFGRKAPDDENNADDDSTDSDSNSDSSSDSSSDSNNVLPPSIAVVLNCILLCLYRAYYI